MDKKDKGKNTDNQPSQESIPFKPIDTETQGVTLGSGDAGLIDFNTKGQRLVGLLTDIRHLDKPHNSMLYEFQNINGVYRFWGSAILDDRLADVPKGKIIDITYEGDQKGKGGGESYKVFTVKYYTPPDGFDLSNHTLYLDYDKDIIQFVVKGTPVPDSAIPF